MALALQMSRYEAVAKRWSLAQEQGRTLSLKKWLNSGDRSVLVLPFADTHADEEILRPLNGAMLEVLTHILFSQAEEQPQSDTSYSKTWAGVLSSVWLIFLLPRVGFSEN